MRRIAAVIVISFLLSTMVGCGTMANLDGRDAILGVPSRPPVPLGGVANDWNWMMHGSIDALEPSRSYDRGFTFMIGLWDMPFSVVGDVITLPLVTFEFLREEVLPTDRYDKDKYKNPYSPTPMPAPAPAKSADS